MIHNRIEIWRLLALCLLLTACSQANKPGVDLISETPTAALEKNSVNQRPSLSRGATFMFEDLN